MCSLLQCYLFDKCFINAPYNWARVQAAADQCTFKNHLVDLCPNCVVCARTRVCVCVDFLQRYFTLLAICMWCWLYYLLLNKNCQFVKTLWMKYMCGARVTILLLFLLVIYSFLHKTHSRIYLMQWNTQTGRFIWYLGVLLIEFGFRFFGLWRVYVCVGRIANIFFGQHQQQQQQQ